MLLIEGISKLGFSVEISRQRPAGQEREAEDQPAPFSNGIFDTHTQGCRGLDTRAQRRYLSASPQAASWTGGSDEKTFLRWLLIIVTLCRVSSVTIFIYDLSYYGRYL